MGNLLFESVHRNASSTKETTEKFVLLVLLVLDVECLSLLLYTTLCLPGYLGIKEMFHECAVHAGCAQGDFKLPDLCKMYTIPVFVSV